MISDSNDEANSPHELLLTDRQVSTIRKAFSNNSSVDIKFWKTQLSKMIQSGGFLGKLLGPLLKTGLPLIFFNWDLLHARMHSHYKAWSYKKRIAKKYYRIQKICLERTYT